MDTSKNTNPAADNSNQDATLGRDRFTFHRNGMVNQVADQRGEGSNGRDFRVLCIHQYGIVGVDAKGSVETLARNWVVAL